MIKTLGLFVGIIGLFIPTIVTLQVPFSDLHSYDLSHIPLVEARHSVFNQYIADYDKEYATMNEHVKRFEIFSSNLDTIDYHNSKQSSYTLDVNEFADLTREEFKAKLTPHSFSKRPISTYNTDLTNVSLPAALDWRVASENPKNIVAVTGVKNQQQCGSCWSFSASGATEGAWSISGNPLTSLSEQQMVDCSSNYGNNGCNGGLMDNAFKYIMKNGLCTETSYPYKAVDGKCQTCTLVAHLNGFVDVASGDENGIMTQIQLGPVSVAIEADQAVFQFYSGGILDDTSCGTNLDHGVLAVGYGVDTTSNKPYWIVKNSWGTGWGLNGYILIARGKNMCGISQMASRPYYTNKITSETDVIEEVKSGFSCAWKLASIFACDDNVSCIITKSATAVIDCESYVCPRLPQWMRTWSIVPVCAYYCGRNSC